MATPDHQLDAPPWQRVEATLMATVRTIRWVYKIRYDDLGLNLARAKLAGVLAEDRD